MMVIFIDLQRGNPSIPKSREVLDYSIVFNKTDVGGVKDALCHVIEPKSPY